MSCEFTLVFRCVALVLSSFLALNSLAQTQRAAPGYNAVSQSGDETAMLRAQEDDFIRHFLELNPQQRVALWKRSSGFHQYIDATVEWRTQREMRSALIVKGLDAVPFLADTLRHGDLGHRIAALELLYDMDRFMPTANLPIPMGPSVYVRVLQQGGRINPFQPVDGRRIGSIGYQAVEWAVSQTNNSELNFHARALSGNLKTELAALPLTEQFRIWREAVMKSRGASPSNRDQSIKRNVLDEILIQELPKSLSGFSEVLAEEKDPSVVEAAITDLRRSDACRTRLRGSQEGLQTVDAIRSVLHRETSPGRFPNEAQTKDEFWKTLSAQFFDDQIRLDPTSTWAVYVQAFEVLYNRKLAGPVNSFVGRGPAPPETGQFITYLTELDPSFPSWEYSYCPNDGQGIADEVMHPGFKTKIHRYFDAWIQFESRVPGPRLAP